MYKYSVYFLCAFALSFLACKKDLSPAEQLTQDIQLIKDDLVAKGITANETADHIFYVIATDGTGIHPNINNTVTVAYRGQYLDGVVFDETNANNPSATFGLRQVIEGWQLAVPLLKRGGKGRFWIPSGLCYGPNPQNGVRKNAAMVFDIDLIDF